MTDHSSNADRGLALQRHVTTLVLEQIGGAGFALAGSSAIREHGITDRPTNDVDLFTTTAVGSEAFAAAVTTAEHVLRDHGYHVTRTRSTPEFVRLMVEAVEGQSSGREVGLVVEMDFGVDWRAEPPTQFAIGPVLALRDAVGNKVAAVYSRGEARDFLDLDAIRQSERFTDHDLLALAKEHDPGFEAGMFVQQLRRVRELGPVETAEYGVDAARLQEVQVRLATWAANLLEQLADTGRPPLQPPTTQPRATRRPEDPPQRSDQTITGPDRDTGGPSIGL